jgi:hypothetical protein
MIAERYIYYIVYIIFLIFLVISLWFLVIYTNAPIWIGWTFVVGIVLLIMGALIKEHVMVDYDYWAKIYITLQVIALIMIIIGIIFAMIYSNITWAVWILFGLGILFVVVGNMLMALLPCNTAYGVIVSITGFIIFIVLLFAVFSQGPRSINADLTLTNVFWYFPFLALTVIIGILSVLFETVAEPVWRCCCNKNPCCCKFNPCCVEEPKPCCVEEQKPCCVEEPKPCCIEEPKPCCIEEPKPCCIEEPKPCCIEEPKPCCVEEKTEPCCSI